MEISTIILVTLGLALFEIITSIDNAIINAEVLSTMSKKGQKWFLFWGILFAVFIIRGVLPLIIVWLSTPGITPMQALTATFSGNKSTAKAIENSSPLLLSGGGTFLILLFLNWIFLENKNFGLVHERIIDSLHNRWFYFVSALVIALLAILGLQINPQLPLSIIAGLLVFVLIHALQKRAEREEKSLLKSKGVTSDTSKIIYLEILDATFSIDGVVGAFAFTFSVPLILIGNGIGALILRTLTVQNIENIKKYKYLKNGAMYSIAILGLIMILDSFGAHIPEWLSPVATFAVVGFFLYRSKKGAQN
jgi:hypothetical protein